MVAKGLKCYKIKNQKILGFNFQNIGPQVLSSSNMRDYSIIYPFLGSGGLEGLEKVRGLERSFCPHWEGALLFNPVSLVFPSTSFLSP